MTRAAQVDARSLTHVRPDRNKTGYQDTRAGYKCEMMHILHLLCMLQVETGHGRW